MLVTAIRELRTDLKIGPLCHPTQSRLSPTFIFLELGTFVALRFPSVGQIVPSTSWPIASHLYVNKAVSS